MQKAVQHGGPDGSVAEDISAGTLLSPLVVIAIDVFKYRWETTYNNAEATSASSEGVGSAAGRRAPFRVPVFPPPPAEPDMPVNRALALAATAAGWPSPQDVARLYGASV